MRKHVRTSRPRSFAILVLLLFYGCGKERSSTDEPRALLLSRGVTERAPFSARDWKPAAAGCEVRLTPAEDEQGYWLVSTIDASQWNRIGAGAIWWARRPFPGQGFSADSTSQRLSGEDGAYQMQIWLSDPLDSVAEQPGLFSAFGDKVYVVRPKDSPPPGTLELQEYLRFDEVDDVGRRVTIGPVIADGIPLLPGTQDELVVDIPAGSALSFWTSAVADDWAEGTPVPPSQVRFRVELDGEELLDHALALANGASTVHHSVDLPSAGRRRAKLVFALEGDPAIAAIHVPCIHPSGLDESRAPAEGSARPDIVFLMLDTFRADNMEAYGGDPRFAPHLNELARSSLVFRTARSNASWTLPTHATLFSGLLPYRSGCASSVDRLSNAAVSLAERLRAGGYRTVAITDAGFVRRDYGLAQGFEYFLERQRRGEGSFEETLGDVRALLDADDGRPLFLFVQTYRAHDPYEVTDETRAELGEELGIKGTWRELIAEMGMPGIDGKHADLTQFNARAEPLYRGGVHDLDRGVGQLLEELETRDVLPAGVLIVTSDHGEAFGEHGRWGHGSDVHEEQVRVPLLFYGGGIQPGVVDATATLLDLPPTICALAGLTEEASWDGYDLLPRQAGRGSPDRTQFLFVGAQPGRKTQESMATVQGAHKAILPSIHAAESGWRAYSLTEDPGELVNAAAQEWARRMISAGTAAVPAVTTPILSGGRANLSAEARRHLSDLGYGSD